jgi:hypothetical protein
MPKLDPRNYFARCEGITSQLDSSQSRHANRRIDTELLRDDRRGFLPDDKSSPVRVRADIPRHDGQVSNFEAMHTVHVQLRVYDSALLTRLHRTSAELMRNRECKDTRSTTPQQCAGERRTHRVPGCGHYPAPE